MPEAKKVSGGEKGVRKIFAAPCGRHRVDPDGHRRAPHVTSRRAPHVTNRRAPHVTNRHMPATAVQLMIAMLSGIRLAQSVHFTLPVSR